MIKIDDTFSNSLDRDPPYVCLRDKEYGMLVFDIKPPIQNTMLSQVVEMGAVLYCVKLVGVQDMNHVYHYTVHGLLIDNLMPEKVTWVRFSEHCKSQLVGLLSQNVRLGKIKSDEWVYFLIGKSYHFVFLNKEGKDDKTT